MDAVWKPGHIQNSRTSKIFDVIGVTGRSVIDHSGDSELGIALEVNAGHVDRDVQTTIRSIQKTKGLSGVFAEIRVICDGGRHTKTSEFWTESAGIGDAVIGNAYLRESARMSPVRSRVGA